MKGTESETEFLHTKEQHKIAHISHTRVFRHSTIHTTQVYRGGGGREEVRGGGVPIHPFHGIQ